VLGKTFEGIRLRALVFASQSPVSAAESSKDSFATPQSAPLA